MVGSNLWNAIQTSYKLVGTRKKIKIKMKLNIAACDKLPCTVWNAVFEMLLWEWPTFRITELVLVWLYLHCCSTSVIKVKEKRFLWAKECISRRKEELPSCVENWDCTKKDNMKFRYCIFRNSLVKSISFVITNFIISSYIWHLFFLTNTHESLCSQNLFS